MSWRLVTVSLSVLIAGSALAHAGQRQADAVRRHLEVGQELLFAPRGDILRPLSLDFHVLTADVLWMRGVLEFGSRFGRAWDPQVGEWFRRTILAVTELDERWRTPYLYGGLMLKVTGFFADSTEVFKRGAEHIPDDHYLPFAVGMNYYLLLHDQEQAAHWLEIASERPNAPDWYALTAVAIREKRHDRHQVVQFLQEELASTTDPKLRGFLEERLKATIHDEIASLFAQVNAAFIDRFGRPPKSVDELVEEGLMRDLPPDPLGGHWVIDVDGAILSSVVAEQNAARDLRFERHMLTVRR